MAVQMQSMKAAEFMLCEFGIAARQLRRSKPMTLLRFQAVAITNTWISAAKLEFIGIMTNLRSAFVSTFLLLSMAGYLVVPGQAHAQVSIADDGIRMFMNALRHSRAIFGAGKAASATLRVGKSTRIGNLRAVLALRAKRAVRNKSVSGNVVENNLPDWSELRALSAIIDAETDAARLSLTADEVAKTSSSAVTKPTSGHAAQSSKGKTLLAVKQVPRRCEINLCEASALSGNRQLKGSCGPAEISGSQAGGFGFEFGIGPGSVSVSTGSSGTTIGGSAKLTECLSMDFSQEIDDPSADTTQLAGAGCKPCGIGFNQLVELFDGPATEIIDASMDSGLSDLTEIEDLFGDTEDWQELRGTIAGRNPDSSIGPDLRDNHYLIEASKLKHGEEIRVLEDIWRQLGASTGRVAQEAIECAALYCPPNRENAITPEKSRLRFVVPSWLRGSCSIPVVGGEKNQFDKIWFHIVASMTTVNLISDTFPEKGSRKPPMSNRMRPLCMHNGSGAEGANMVDIQEEEISSSLTGLIDRFSSETAFK